MFKKPLTKKSKILIGACSGVLTVGALTPAIILLSQKHDNKIKITKEHFDKYYNQSVQTLYSQAKVYSFGDDGSAYDTTCALVNAFESERSNYLSKIDSGSEVKDY
jgi:hypothetical protein